MEVDIMVIGRGNKAKGIILSIACVLILCLSSTSAGTVDVDDKALDALYDVLQARKDYNPPFPGLKSVIEIEREEATLLELAEAGPTIQIPAKQEAVVKPDKERPCLCVCKEGENKTVRMAGENDDFDPDGDVPPASPSTGLQTRLTSTGGNIVGFDSTQTDRWFAHTFTNLPSNITRACLEIRMKVIGGQPWTDFIHLSFTDDDGNLIEGKPTWYRKIDNLLPPNKPWTQANYPKGHTFTINLDHTLIYYMNNFGYLDLTVQDDTSVDYALLVVCSSPEPLTGQICGIKFLDKNSNGIQDPGEEVLQGWTILVKDEKGNVVGKTTTGPKGEYCITVRPGTYTVEEKPQFGWQQTSPQTQTVTVAAGQTVSNINFGNRPGPKGEHYLCYRVKKGESKRLEVKLRDQFGETRAVVLKPVYLLVPVSKNGERIIDPKLHLVCYEIKTKQRVEGWVEVKNQFGKQRLYVEDANMLCVPSEKIVEGEPPSEGGQDLSLIKGHEPQNFEYGKYGTFLFTVTNNGPGATTRPLVVKETLPGGFTVPVGPFNVGAWRCSGNYPTPGGQSVVCIYNSQLSPGDSVTLNLPMQVASVDDFPGGSDAADNCATVSQGGWPPHPLVEDPRPDNNESCDRVVIVSQGKPTQGRPTAIRPKEEEALEPEKLRRAIETGIGIFKLLPKPKAGRPEQKEEPRSPGLTH